MAKHEDKQKVGDDSGGWDRDWEPLSRSSSVATEIMVNLTILMFTALILISIFVNWTYSVMPEDYASRYAPWIIIPYIIVFGLTVAFYGWRLISRVIIMPLRDLITATHQVAGGDLSSRVEIIEDNELGQLGVSFNEMAETIELGRIELENNLDELQRLNDNLEQAQREVLASEKLASVGRLAAGVAHEIGNPLGSISGYLDVINRRDYLKESEREMIERVQKEIGRINEIIRELLNYSRPADESQELISLNDSLGSTLTLLRAQKGFEKIELETALGDTPLLHANRGALQQLIMNLVINALHAMPDGGELRLSTEAIDFRGRPGVELRVVDTGPGIAPEALDQVFDPFFTTKDPGAGTGLGLSICQRIVENLRGSIRVESQLGQGSAFVVRFPGARRSDRD